jgi:membrane associated rhomboid family serine protease
VASHETGVPLQPESEHLRREPVAAQRPIFSWILFAVCVAGFLPQLATPGVEMSLSIHGPDIAAGEWWRVLTAQVEHHGYLHILLNGLSILGFGPFVERRVGSIRLALESLFAALVGSAFALYFNWDAYTAGASVMLSSWLGMGIPIVEPRWRRVLVQWALFNVLLSLGPHVSWAGHLGGFLAGLLSGLLMRRSDRVVPPTHFRLFDRLLPLLLAGGVGLILLAVRFHTVAPLRG